MKHIIRETEIICGIRESFPKEKTEVKEQRKIFQAEASVIFAGQLRLGEPLPAH